MYLSLLMLDPRSRDASRDVASPYELHSTLERVFNRTPEAQSRGYLFRLDYSAPKRLHQVLVLSRVEPNFSTLPNGYTLEIKGPKPYAPTILVGQRLSFHLLANPTCREKRDERNNKPRKPILDSQAQTAWLQRKLNDMGAEAIEWRIEVRPTVRAHKRGEKARTEKEQTLVPVLFEGVLQVNHPEVFTNKLPEGLGSAKGYGFGLLSLAPA